MANRFSNDSFKITTTGPATRILNGITSADVALNTSTITPAGGDAFDDIHNVATQTPEIAVTTESLAGILDKVPFINGLCLTDPGTGFYLYMQAHSLCGSVPRLATASSVAQIEAGRILLESVSASPGANTTVSFRVHATSETGAVEPIVWTHGSITLPTVDAGYKNEMYSLGKVIVAGTVIDKVTNVSINYNHSVLKPITAGSIWPVEVAVTKTSPTISITTEDTTLIEPGAYTTSGLVVTHANTNIQFRKRADNAAFISDITGEHVNLTAAGVAYIRQVYTASGNATGTSVIGINTIFDGTLNPIAWDTAWSYTP